MINFLKKYEIFFVGALILLTATMAGYRLTESPPVWFDEGIFTQVAENLAQHQTAVIQLAPGQFVSASNIASVGYPLLHPVAASLHYFGVGVWQARAPMVLWIIILVSAAYYLIRELFGQESALWSSLLLVSFAPLYGNGKSVLGEIPGLALLLLFCLFLLRALRVKSASNFVPAGLAAGLCIATKPLFILIVPATIVGWLIYAYLGRVHFTVQEVLIFCGASLVPLVIWLLTSFSKENSVAAILSWYLNPYSYASMYGIVFGNLQRLFTESTPIYFTAATAIWFAAIMLRVRLKDDRAVAQVSLVEFILAIFVLLVGIFYLRTPGWYRYFFPGHVVGLLFLPPALFWFAGRYANKIKYFGITALRLALAAVIVFQFYQVGWASFVARSYDSHNSAELAKYFSELPAEQTVFLYQVPEAAIFISDRTGYYQYFSPRPSQAFGEENFILLKRGVIGMIIARSDLAEEVRRRFPVYEKSSRIGHYVVLEQAGR